MDAMRSIARLLNDLETYHGDLAQEYEIDLIKEEFSEMTHRVVDQSCEIQRLKNALALNRLELIKLTKIIEKRILDTEFLIRG